jgi:ABC-type sugar transport system ATPase subunit
MASVGIRDVGKAFGATQVIHGAFLAPVGPAGSGNRTPLRVIAGLENIRIRIGERAANVAPNA